MKEALDEKQATHGEPRKLIHLKATEVVADGCTKPLQGQAFFKFLDDLGVTREHGQDGGNEPQSSGGGTQLSGGSRQTATKAIMVGSLLMSSARAMEKDVTESNDMTPVLVTGAILMALGAVYAGQLVYEVSQRCLKRLRAPRDGDCHDEGGDIVAVSEDEGNVMFTSTSLQRLGSKERTGRKAGAASTTSLNMTSQSGKGTKKGRSTAGPTSM